MTHSQATDKYLAMSLADREKICREAIKTQTCIFCGAEPGHGCILTPNMSKVLDGFAHTGRWMRYLIAESEIGDML